MEFCKNPILRVPLVLFLSGLICRITIYLAAFISVQLPKVQGPGSYYRRLYYCWWLLPKIMSRLSFLLFC